MATALIIVDMQNDFVSGTLGNEKAKAIVPNIVNEIKFNAYDYIFFTKDYHSTEGYKNSIESEKIPAHCNPNEWGYNLVPELSSVVFNNSMIDIPTFILNKNTFLCHDWATYLDQIEDLTDITIVGVCTDICVISNALYLRSLYPNVNIFVKSNCCAGTTEELHKKALDVMRSCLIHVL